MTANLDKIKAKIAALLAKNAENGASEAEALAALGIAQKMMAEYGISEEDIKKEEAQSEFIHDILRPGRKNMHEVDLYCGVVIARFCDCKTWIEKVRSWATGKKEETVRHFIGHFADIELAKYVREVIMQAMENDFRIYYEANKGKVHGRTLRKGFMFGFAMRMNERMNEMKAAAKKEMESTGTNLVVLKNAMIQNVFNDLGVHLEGGGKRTHNNLNGNAMDAGAAAANKVNLGRPVTAQPKGPLLLVS